MAVQGDITEMLLTTWSFSAWKKVETGMTREMVVKSLP